MIKKTVKTYPLYLSTISQLVFKKLFKFVLINKLSILFHSGGPTAAVLSSNSFNMHTDRDQIVEKDKEAKNRRRGDLGLRLMFK